MPRAASVRVRFWIELSGEHPTLPRAEALAALEAEGVRLRKVAASATMLQAEGEGPVLRAVSRLALAHVVCEELARGDFEDLRAFARSCDLKGVSFRTHARSLDGEVDRIALEGPLGADFGKTGRVDLTSPAVDFRVLVTEEFLLGRVIHRVDRRGMEGRKVTRRSFQRPITLHPKLAHALVNLSRVPVGGLLADPFCGTGGIVLEASRMGVRSIGGDIRRTMVAGARTALRDLGAQAEFLVADAGHPPWGRGSLGGIATDPPYGRAATTRGEPPLALYKRAFAAFDEALPRGGCVAITLPSDRAVAVGEERLELLERHAFRVHRSLTRHFCVFVRRS